MSQVLSDNYGKPVKDYYPDGVCPDCADDIPESYRDGDNCLNCGHVFYAEREID